MRAWAHWHSLEVLMGHVRTNGMAILCWVQAGAAHVTACPMHAVFLSVSNDAQRQGQGGEGQGWTAATLVDL